MTPPGRTLAIPHTGDFEVTGDGSHPSWSACSWTPLRRVGDGSSTYATCAKVLWSETGLYFLVDCEDRRLMCTKTQDFDDIYREDVVEVFIWPDESLPVYFEYELSPLGVELPIMVPNVGGKFFGWLPWHYEKGRRTRRATSIRGGTREPLAHVTGWSVEFFVPYLLLAPVGYHPPQPGDCWRGNLYRIDYDELPASQWAWDTSVDGNFHDYTSFGWWQFEK